MKGPGSSLLHSGWLDDQRNGSSCGQNVLDAAQRLHLVAFDVHLDHAYARVLGRRDRESAAQIFTSTAA